MYRSKIHKTERPTWWPFFHPESHLQKRKATKQQSDLAAELLAYIALRMCHFFTDEVFDRHEAGSDAAREELKRRYSDVVQEQALTGAFMTHDFVGAWGTGCSCLRLWDITEASMPDDDRDIYQQMKIDASDIPALVEKTDVNLQVYGVAVAAFFHLDHQLNWAEPYIGWSVSIRDNLADQFIAAGLVENIEGYLLWTDEALDHCISSQVIRHHKLEDRYKIKIDEEPGDFFNRISAPVTYADD
ncbi:MAG: hypothetical protein AAGE89_05995 [Pseudomonadota bacterium]